jgi:Helix-turn-helix domain
MTDTMTIGNSTLANDLSLPPQARTILAHLVKGKSITPMESLIVYGIYRLSDCIFKIRNAGHDVLTLDRKDERGKKYGEYQLRTRLSLN